MTAAVNGTRNSATNKKLKSVSLLRREASNKTTNKHSAAAAFFRVALLSAKSIRYASSSKNPKNRIDSFETKTGTPTFDYHIHLTTTDHRTQSLIRATPRVVFYQGVRT